MSTCIVLNTRRRESTWSWRRRGEPLSDVVVLQDGKPLNQSQKTMDTRFRRATAAMKATFGFSQHACTRW